MKKKRERRTLNVEHPTSNIEWNGSGLPTKESVEREMIYRISEFKIGRSTLGVRCLLH
jgi:hypothetical protein